MLLLEGHSIKYYVQDRLLLNLASIKIESHERIGLVGRNGAGKTTLLKMISGELSIEEGTITTYSSVQLVPQIKRTDMTKSGGEITQNYLQDALNHYPGLLLLDEPTTHLDLERIEWLEKKLKDYQGGLIIVAHDRVFLDRLCTSIWEINDGTITVYKGNYSDYIEQKELERNQQQTAFEKYEKEKQQLEAAIQEKEVKAQRATKKPKNLSASDARRKGAKPYYANKQKKLRKTASAFETRLEQLEEVKKREELPELKMDVLQDDIIQNQVIIRTEQISGEMEGHTLWNPIDFYIRSGEIVAVIGQNGVGKTTLLKNIINKKEGITISPAVKIGYFSQDLRILDEKKTILENIQLSSKQNETFIRTVLARMHFRGDDVYKKVDVLSGGEKVKVALSKIFLSDVNVLVLDEPTNFLDVYSLEALEELLQNYQGTIIFATHDRMFIQKIATKILEISNQEITIFDGTYKEYMEQENNLIQDSNEDELLLLETKISDVLSRLSVEPSEELEAEFQTLLKEKQKFMNQS